MQNTIFSQTMRTSAYQTWNISKSFGFAKGNTEVMFQAGSIVDCGNSVINHPLLDPRILAVLE